MSINRTSLLILIMRPLKNRLALLLPCSLICFIAFLPVTGDIAAVPGQSLEGQLDLLVSAPQGAQISITPPLDISEWQIVPDETNQETGTLNIKANKDGWQVTAMDSDTVTSGHMTEWTGSAYSSYRLTNPMKVKAANEVPLPSEGVIQTGDKTKGNGQDIDVVFTQEGSFIDPALPAGHVYRIIVTFTGSYS